MGRCLLGAKQGETMLGVLETDHSGDKSHDLAGHHWPAVNGAGASMTAAIGAKITAQANTAATSPVLPGIEELDAENSGLRDIEEWSAALVYWSQRAYGPVVSPEYVRSRCHASESAGDRSCYPTGIAT